MNMNQEEWRPITWDKRLPINMYEISNFGNVRNIRTKHQLNQTLSQTNAKVCSIYTRTVPVMFHIGRNVAIAFVPIPHNLDHKYFMVFYKDGDKSNCRADNLEWRMYGGMTYEEKKRYLDFIYNHKDLRTTELSDLYFKEYGVRISKQNFQNVRAGLVSDTVSIFGYKPTDFKANLVPRNPLTEKDIRRICEILCKTRSIRQCLNQCKNLKINVTYSQIYRIYSKESHALISDEYFDYYGRGEFYPREQIK